MPCDFSEQTALFFRVECRGYRFFLNSRIYEATLLLVPRDRSFKSNSVRDSCLYVYGRDCHLLIQCHIRVRRADYATQLFQQYCL